MMKFKTKTERYFRDNDMNSIAIVEEVTKKSLLEMILDSEYFDDENNCFFVLYSDGTYVTLDAQTTDDAKAKKFSKRNIVAIANYNENTTMIYGRYHVTENLIIEPMTEEQTEKYTYAENIEEVETETSYIDETEEQEQAEATEATAAEVIETTTEKRIETAMKKINIASVTCRSYSDEITVITNSDRSRTETANNMKQTTAEFIENAKYVCVEIDYKHIVNPVAYFTYYATEEQAEAAEEAEENAIIQAKTDASFYSAKRNKDYNWIDFYHGHDIYKYVEVKTGKTATETAAEVFEKWLNHHKEIEALKAEQAKRKEQAEQAEQTAAEMLKAIETITDIETLKQMQKQADAEAFKQYENNYHKIGMKLSDIGGMIDKKIYELSTEQEKKIIRLKEKLEEAEAILYSEYGECLEYNHYAEIEAEAAEIKRRIARIEAEIKAEQEQAEQEQAKRINISMQFFAKDFKAEAIYFTEKTAETNNIDELNGIINYAEQTAILMQKSNNIELSKTFYNIAKQAKRKIKEQENIYNWILILKDGSFVNLKSLRKCVNYCKSFIHDFEKYSTTTVKKVNKYCYKIINFIDFKEMYGEQANNFECTFYAHYRNTDKFKNDYIKYFNSRKENRKRE